MSFSILVWEKGMSPLGGIRETIFKINHLCYINNFVNHPNSKSYNEHCNPGVS